MIFILKMQQVPLSALNIAKNLICFDLPKNKIHKLTLLKSSLGAIEAVQLYANSIGVANYLLRFCCLSLTSMETREYNLILLTILPQRKVSFLTSPAGF